MVAKAKTILRKRPGRGTLNLSIPADLAKDSQFPFRDGEEVLIVIIDEPKGLNIRPIQGDE